MPITPFSLLLVDRPSAGPDEAPPGTRSKLKAFLSAITTTPFAGPSISDGGPGDIERMVTAMERATADHHVSHCFARSEISLPSLERLRGILPGRSIRMRLSLACGIGQSTDATPWGPVADEPIVQVQWRAAHGLPDLGFFKAVSRAGVWNHLILTDGTATAANRGAVARQPNIVHSWEAIVGDARDGTFDDGYHALAPLPGRPLWQTVDDPVHRFMLIDRFGKNWLLRSRLDDDGHRIFSLGDAMSYHFCPPERLPGGYLDEICAMVAAGGTVAGTYVRSNLERAHLIGYVLENGVIVGNSSLKNPRPEYIDSVNKQTGLDLSGFVERGYTSVRPEYRGLGIGTRLLEGLTARAGDRKIFSVIAEDNEATKIIARRNRTRKVATYHSEKAGKQVGIWMPEWMIDAAQRERS